MQHNEPKGTPDAVRQTLTRLLGCSIVIHALGLLGWCAYQGWELVTESPVHPTWDLRLYLVVRALLIGMVWIAGKLAILAMVRYGRSNRSSLAAKTVGCFALAGDLVGVIAVLVSMVPNIFLPIVLATLGALSIIGLLVTRNWCRQGLISVRVQQAIEIGWLAFLVLGASAGWWIWQKDFNRRIVSGGTETFTWGYGLFVFLTAMTICSVREWRAGGCITGSVLFKSLAVAMVVTYIFVVLMEVGWAFVPFPFLFPIAILLHGGILYFAWRVTR